MSCGGHSTDWGELPTLVLSQIFGYLNTQDRLNASLTCHHWRSVLFQKRFFNDFKFKLCIDNERQCVFFRHTICNLTKELTIIFDFLNVYHIENIRRILYKVARCENIQGVRFETNNVGLATPGGICTNNNNNSHNINKRDLVDIEQAFVEPLKLFLNRKIRPCEILDLGCIEALTYYGIELMRSLAKPQHLNTLTLASLKYNPSHYPIFTLDNSLLLNCSSLQILSLDYDTLSEDLMRAIHVLPLKKLMICVHGLDRSHPGISEATWSEFAARFPNVKLILSLVYAYEAVEVLHVRVLRKNMPITHLRVLFCDFMNVDALEWMSLHNNTTLQSVQWIDSAYKHSDKDIMDLFLRSGQDPFVMMSWRCKNLEEIVIHGYVLDPHNLVGISRLRGRKLKRFEVSLVDTIPTDKPMNFMEEISYLLGHKWKPISTHNLHPALGYLPVSDDVRDSYVFDLMRRDIVQL